jgi:GNAT superfamily N-acetyltransferase
MNIYQAKPSKHQDLVDLMWLQLTCLPHDEPMDANTGLWWIAKDGDKLAGFAGMIPSVRWMDTIYLCRAGVVPAFRGKGLQKRLIRARINKAKKLGYKWVITDTTDNPASSNSLIGHGFKLFEPTKPWSFSNSLYFRLKIG